MQRKGNRNNLSNLRKAITIFLLCMTKALKKLKECGLQKSAIKAMAALPLLLISGLILGVKIYHFHE